MSQPKHVRFRDAILGLFSEKALRLGLHADRVRTMQDKVMGIPRSGGERTPGGDLVIMGGDGTAIVDVGGHGGALSILRCWHYCAIGYLAKGQSITLFYVAITRPGQNHGEMRA